MWATDDGRPHPQTKFKSKGNPESVVFFTCLEIRSNTDAALWLRGMKKNVKRVTFERAKEEGMSTDKSKVPVYLHHIQKMAAAWSEKGGAVDAVRKFQVLCLWLAAGRSSETAWMSWDSMDYDTNFCCLFAEMPQSEISDYKSVCYMAGACAESCFFTCMGDDLALNGHGRLYVDELGAWVFPELQQAKNPGTVIGDSMKALLPRERGGQAGHAHVSIQSLPDGINASSIRPGTANTMAQYMPAEFVANVTGHELNGRSALYEYLEVWRALLIPGALVLAGWPALPWGQLGRGSVPASVASLQSIGVSMDVLEPFVDDVLHLDSASPPQLRLGGAVRQAAHAAVASLVMYYVQRSDKDLLPRLH